MRNKVVIYKQDAIDAVADGLKMVFVENRDVAEILLKNVPSAQPDGISLEWIDKHLEWLDNCDNDFAQLAKVSIRAMVEMWKKDKT